MKQFRISLKMMLALTLIWAINTQSANAQQKPTMWVVQITEPVSGIGSSRDQARFKAEVETAAHMAEMKLDIKQFNRFDNGIGAYINALEPAEDDVLWVYYSGHGENSGRDIWPMFDNDENTFNLKGVYEKIKNKDCRLKIAMYDCCNMEGNQMNSNNPLVGSRLPSSAYVFMFRKTEGSIIACSSKSGDYSYGDTNVGGFFTDGFFRAIGQVDYQTADQQKNIWNNVLSQTVMNTELMSSSHAQRQTPQYRLELNGDAACAQPVTPIAAPNKKRTNAPAF